MSASNSANKEKAIRLFEFLKELSLLGHRNIRNISDYDEVLWLDEIPTERGCYFRGWTPVCQRDLRHSGRVN